MATVRYRPREGRWVVRWIEPNRKQHWRGFDTEAEALAFHATLPANRRSGPRTADEVAALIIARSEDADDDCRLWTGPLTNAGYGRLTWVCDEGYLIRGAHRLAYHLFVAPVPADRLLSIDHLCRVRHCVNPAHLELVRQRENVMRSPIAVGAINARKTHCAQGHPYNEENTYTYTFKTRATTVRVCRTCRRAYYERRQAERVAAAR